MLDSPRLSRKPTDDVEVSYPATQRSDFGLLPPDSHLRKQDLGVSIFLVGEGASDSRCEVCVFYGTISLLLSMGDDTVVYRHY